MNELLKIISSPQLFEVLNFLKDNPDMNSSAIAKSLGYHTFTVQRYLEVMEKFNIVAFREEKKIGRPSKKYRYIGGKITIDINEILSIFKLKGKRIRERSGDFKYSYDLNRETIKGVILNKEKIKFNEIEGKVLFLIPPVNSNGITACEISEKININEFDVLCALKKFLSLNLIEVVE
ncbi:putative ArsR family transcriptional regulator [Thermosipho japonicus]|uniref:Putative ArsR family transcriptional regulator n=1 Tax=Thermosipho japonicus TaxID=90323 RepID=A0A841GJZ5_9BACT|nr:transcriptional regulator [Thermosipho japonicus]MBB6062325.1 putative ArsR family transcriptional regulator [Thermosipho japonicus]